MTARMVILPPEQARSLRGLASQSAAKVLNAAAVSTPSRRQAYIRPADWQRQLHPGAEQTRGFDCNPVAGGSPKPSMPLLLEDGFVRLPCHKHAALGGASGLRRPPVGKKNRKK